MKNLEKILLRFKREIVDETVAQTVAQTVDLVVAQTVELTVARTVPILRQDILQGVDDKLRHTTDLLRQEIRASEHRTKTELRHEMQKVEGRITANVCSLLEQQVLP